MEINNLFVLDELGEALSEGDVVVFESIAWIVTKIAEVPMPQIVDPKFMKPDMPRKRMLTVKLNTEFTFPVLVGQRIPKIFKSSKRMSQTDGNNPSDS